MISQLFLDVGQYLVLLILLLAALKQLKLLLITHTGSIGKSTDHDEVQNMNINFMAYDTIKSMRRKLGRLHDLALERYRHNLANQKKIFSDAENEKAEELRNRKVKVVR